MSIVFAEYIWIDGSKPTQTLRSKTKAISPGQFNQREVRPGVTSMSGGKNIPEDFPEWGFDGSSTQQATGDKSDCILRPVAVFPDPIRLGHYLVMCEVFTADGQPHPSNQRAKLRELIQQKASTQDSLKMMECFFGLEQEYTLFKGSRPLGFGEDRRFPAAQGPYYCGVGADEVFGRKLVEAHMYACAAAGILISGVNAEVMPGQWEFQVGPLGPLDVGDHLWVARWLLYRLGEDHGIHATLDPKPVPGDWNGAGMHTNFSTAEMRKATLMTSLTPAGGMAAIERWCEEAGKHVEDHLAAYGDGIEARLTGKHETCSFRQFKWGVSDRTASIRIPLSTFQQGYGYLEDRRPNANACPYAVATVVLKTAFKMW